MMQMAQPWVKSNPDYDSTEIVIPGTGSTKSRSLEVELAKIKVQKVIDRCENEAEKLNILKYLQNDLDKSMKIAMEADALDSELRSSEKELSATISRTGPSSQEKWNISEDIHAAVLSRWLLQWARDGYNVFDLSQDFVASMLLTDPSELDFARIPMPFRGLLITIPSEFAVGAEGGHYTKIHVCEFTKVYKNTDGDGLVRGEENDRALYIQASDGDHVIETLIDSASLSSQGWKALDDIPESLDVTDDADKIARKTIRQIVFGMLSYISAVQGSLELRVVQQKKKHKVRQSNDESPKTWNVGRTISIDPRLVKAARSGRREVAFQIKHRYIVRGHYRNQACGPGNKERKMIYILPFWKGPDEGAKLVHTYRIEGEQA